VRTIDVGIRHDDNLVVPELRKIEILSDACPEACDDRLKLVVADYFIEAGFFHIEHFAPEREDRLIHSIAAHLG